LYEFLLIGPLLILFLLLIYHSVKTQGTRTTLLFFGLGLFFALLREIIIGLTFPLYFGKFKIGPISPAIVFGWVFAFYLAHYFAMKITTNTNVENHLLVNVALGTFVVLGISLIMETTAPILEWWSWKAGLLESLPPETLILGAPIFVFIGWTITGATFLTIFYLLKNHGIKSKTVLGSCLIYTIIMVNFVIGNYFILNPPPVQLDLFYQMQFTFILLILASFYIRKIYPSGLYENITLLVFFVFYAFQLGYWLIIFLVNSFEIAYQILFISFSILYLLVTVLEIRRIYPIIDKQL
jgi:hypothetical protein